MELKNKTGLDLLLAMLAGELPMPSIVDTMPMKILAVRKGYIKFSGTPDERHLNPAGTVHGGFYATLLDSVLGNAIFSELEEDVGYSTVDLNVKMLGSIQIGQEVYAEARVVKVSRQIGVAEATIQDADGKILGHGTTTCLIHRKAS